MVAMTIPVPTLPDLDTLERLAREASELAPGPWYWRGNTDYEDPYLACNVPSLGRVEVLGHCPVPRTRDSFEAQEYIRKYRDTFRVTDAEAEAELDRWVWADQDYEVPNEDLRLSVTSGPHNHKQPVRDLVTFEVAHHRNLPVDTPRTHEGIHRGTIIDVRAPIAQYLAAASADAVLDLIGQVRSHTEAVRKVLKMHDTIWYDPWKHEMLSDYGYGGRCALCLVFDGAACDTVLALGGFPDDE
jgi:hypothetical protein